MQKIRIGGVPEHFNYPWHQCIQRGAFVEKGLDLEWKDFPGGTGAMSLALIEQEIDLAIMLTEGSIKQICDGEDLRIVQKFVDSPLLWGIYVDYHSDYDKIADLENKKVAISREGSGSHLMAYVNAKNEKWNLDKLTFEKAHHLQGAVEALREKRADYFMWEHFTTKPFVDQKIFKHIDDCPTPWPCFVIVAKSAFVKQQQSSIQDILEVVNLQIELNVGNQHLSCEIAEAYQLKKEDVEKWLSKTRWTKNQITKAEIESTLSELSSLGLIQIKGDEIFV